MQTNILQTFAPPGADILSPSGTLLVHLPDDPDDIDESLEDPAYDPIEENPEDAAIRVAVEDTFLGEQVDKANNAERLAGIEQQRFEKHIIINGVEISKARALSKFSKTRKFVSSADRLK